MHWSETNFNASDYDDLGADRRCTDSQINAMLAANRRALAQCGVPNDSTQWKTLLTIECSGDEEASAHFTANCTWRIRWVKGGQCKVRTTAISAYHDWSTYQHIGGGNATTHPNVHPGTYLLGVMPLMSRQGCQVVVEQAVNVNESTFSAQVKRLPRST